MINVERFNEILTEYKSNFHGKHWEKEKFKWESVKWFQDNWDIDASDFGAIVQIHPEDSATWILPHADKYPDVTFIVAHMCSWLGRAYADAIEQAKHGNVWTDTSGMASFYNQGVEYIVNRIGADKILYGSDGYAAGFQRGRIEYAQISDEDKAKILRTNAEKLFAKTLEK